MPVPIALCLENLDDPPERTRFIRCVALSGAEPGLGIDRRGAPLWRGSTPAERACALWVSADERLVLWRLAGAPPVVVRRWNRSLEVPAEQAVMVLDGDELELGGAHWQLYVHGPTTEVHEPTPFWPRAVGAAAIATAMALGAAGCNDEPSTTAATSEPPAGTGTEAVTAAASTATATELASAAPSASASAPWPAASASASAPAAPRPPATAKPPPIEVRPRPPMPVSRPDDGRFGM